MPKTIINSEICKIAGQLLSKMKTNGTTANKLKAVISAHKHGIKTVAKVFGVHVNTIHRWSKQIKDGDLDGLVNKSKHKEGLKIKHEHKTAISEWLKDDPSLTIKEVKLKIEEKYNIVVATSTIHRAMQSVGFSHITPRQQHYKQNKDKVEDFKKKSIKEN